MSKSYTILIADSPVIKDHLQPFTLTRPGWDLRIGIGTLLEKWQWLFGAKGSVVGVVPVALKGLFDGVFESNLKAFIDAKEESPHHTWVVLDTRVLPSKEILSWVMADSFDESSNETSNHTSQLSVNGLPCGLKTTKNHVAIEALQSLSKTGECTTENGAAGPTSIDGSILTNLWDLFLQNGDQIHADLSCEGVPEALGLKTAKASKLPRGVLCDNPSALWLHPNATVEPGCICITSEGPIIVMDGAHVKAGSMLRGPLVIGHHASISMGSKLYGNTTIGPYCKVGGEVKNTIFHSYSNKGHEGFLGNSVVGQWVNLGADTNTSNLKNNYGSVRIWNMATRSWMDSQQQYAGCFLGDHTKTSINTMLNTGTVTGVSALLFGGGFPPKFIPSFAWMDASKPDQHTVYDLDKAIVDMERMMNRRGVDVPEVYKTHMQSLYRDQVVNPHE